MTIQINKVIIAGNLTRDPEVRFLTNERAVANFGLACNRRYRSGDGEQKEETTFVDVECWGRTAELVGQYLTKGRGCLVDGRLKLDTWENQQGERRSKLKVVAENVQFMGGGEVAEGGRQADPARHAPAAPPMGAEPDDDPPF
jgi:single-strand DNA-binding protein